MASMRNDDSIGMSCSKGEGYATAKLSLNDPTGCKDCTDVYIAAALLLDFFREQPGGVRLLVVV